MTSHTTIEQEAVDVGLFRALPLACGLSLLLWFFIAAFAFGIYELTR
jgi:hypothetical protein